MLGLSVWCTLASGSLASTDCICNAGFTGPDGAPCVGCEAGKYKGTAGSDDCADCEAGKYSAEGVTACTSCTAGKYSEISGAAAESDCTVAQETLTHQQGPHLSVHAPLPVWQGNMPWWMARPTRARVVRLVHTRLRKPSVDRLHLQRGLYWTRRRAMRDVRGWQVQGHCGLRRLC